MKNLNTQLVNHADLDSKSAYFAECDRIASIPLTTEERARLDVLTAQAQAAGLDGRERGEFAQLQSRRNS